jgi:hypothetical protein
MSHDYLASAVALQQHEANVIRNYRREMAERFRALADEAEAKALREPDVIEAELLVREAATWRWAALLEDVPEEVVA